MSESNESKVGFEVLEKAGWKRCAVKCNGSEGKVFWEDYDRRIYDEAMALKIQGERDGRKEEALGKSILIPLIVGTVGILFVVGLISNLRDENTYKIPPPGWVIVQDQDGNWGAKFPTSEVVVLPFKHDRNSRQGAIDRAWGQYLYPFEKEASDAKKVQRAERQWKAEPTNGGHNLR